MTTESAHDRIINGLLKGFEGELSPEEFEARLQQSAQIVVSPSRATAHDLWPAVWALASVLERQVRGDVLINAGLREPLPCPVRFGPRVRFIDRPQPAALTIAVGSDVGNAKQAIVGDARAQCVAIGELLPSSDSAPSPVECFVLAGYLGFHALARLAGIPEHRSEFAQATLHVPNDIGALKQEFDVAAGLTCIGQGQVGQAFLALLFFLYEGDFGRRLLHLIDSDRFRTENQRTQILLAEHGDWLGKEKPIYLTELARSWNALPAPFPEEIDWGWRRESHPSIAFVGLHDFKGRRVACAAGFGTVIECGVGTDLLRPRVSWHVFRGDTAAGKRFFADRSATTVQLRNTEWIEALKNTPGQCGWVQFNEISATAPCLGIAAAGFAIADYSKRRQLSTGMASLWSQLLPPLRS